MCNLFSSAAIAPLQLPKALTSCLPTVLPECTEFLVGAGPRKDHKLCKAVSIQVMLYAVGQGDSFVSNVPRPLPSLAALGIVQIACGESHNAVLTIHGQVFTWGRGKYGALGLGAFDSSSWPQHVTALQEPAWQVRFSQNLMIRYKPIAKSLTPVCCCLLLLMVCPTAHDQDMPAMTHA